MQLIKWTTTDCSWDCFVFCGELAYSVKSQQETTTNKPNTVLENRWQTVNYFHVINLHDSMAALAKVAKAIGSTIASLN